MGRSARSLTRLQSAPPALARATLTGMGRGIIFSAVLPPPEDNGSGGRPAGRNVIYTLRIRHAFKKKRRFPRGREIKIRTNTSSGTCGLNLRESQKLGLFFYRDSNRRLSSSSCSRVSRKQLRRAARDLRGSGSRGSNSGCGSSS